MSSKNKATCFRFTPDQRQALETAAGDQSLTDYVTELFEQYVPSFPKATRKPGAPIGNQNWRSKLYPDRYQLTAYQDEAGEVQITLFENRPFGGKPYAILRNDNPPKIELYLDPAFEWNDELIVQAQYEAQLYTSIQERQRAKEEELRLRAGIVELTHGTLKRTVSGRIVYRPRGSKKDRESAAALMFGESEEDYEAAVRLLRGD